MTDSERIKQDLDYVTSAVRREDRPGGVASIYLLWALLIPVGFALPDFAPRLAAIYWIFAGTGGGLLSWWLGARSGRRNGINNAALGRRHGFHWLLSGVAFFLCFLPLASGRVEAAIGVTNFLLVAGITYALAGVHLERPLLYCGLFLLAAYGVMVLASPPYAWTLTGIGAGIALAWAGLAQLRAGRP